MNDLRANVIRLAHTHPELRPHLLPLLAETREAAEKVGHGAVSLRNPDVMLYMIDAGANASKFYEMAVVPKGEESDAKTTKDWRRGSVTAGFVLQRRWGRLTDRGGVTGRVDSMNDVFVSSHEANGMMEKIKREKVSKGYTDVSFTRLYPIGLGAAGFGWGGQAACAFVPELRTLHHSLSAVENDLDSFETPLGKLEQSRSSLAPQLRGYLTALTRNVGQLRAFLDDQLSECRA